ncbi:MAG: CGCGG family rSAM-modified RiPP protein [Haloferacaceae archaeon]
MFDTSHDHGTDPVTDRVHDNSWSANLGTPEYAAAEARIVEGAVEAVEYTVPGNHVNLVTHGDHGHPADSLYPALAERLGDVVEWEYVEQCGCGGHVTRVHVE